MARRILWGSLVLTPVAILARFVFDLNETALFILAAAALIPLAWLISEASGISAAAARMNSASRRGEDEPREDRAV